MCVTDGEGSKDVKKMESIKAVSALDDSLDKPASKDTNANTNIDVSNNVLMDVAEEDNNKKLETVPAEKQDETPAQMAHAELKQASENCDSEISGKVEVASFDINEADLNVSSENPVPLLENEQKLSLDPATEIQDILENAEGSKTKSILSADEPDLKSEITEFTTQVNLDIIVPQETALTNETIVKTTDIERSNNFNLAVPENVDSSLEIFPTELKLSEEIDLNQTEIHTLEYKQKELLEMQEPALKQSENIEHSLENPFIPLLIDEQSVLKSEIIAFTTEVNFDVNATAEAALNAENTTKDANSGNEPNLKMQQKIVEPKRVYVEKSSTVIQIIDPTDAAYAKVLENAPSTSESESANSDSNEYEFKDATEFVATNQNLNVFPEADKKREHRNSISTLSIILVNQDEKLSEIKDNKLDDSLNPFQNVDSEATQLDNNENLVDTDSTTPTIQNLNNDATVNQQISTDINASYVTNSNSTEIEKNISNDTEVEQKTDNEVNNINLDIADESLKSVPFVDKPSHTKLSRKQRRSMRELQKIAREKAKNKLQSQLTSSSDSSGGIPVTSENADCESDEQKTDQVKKLPENQNQSLNDKPVKSTTIVQLAQNSSKTIPTPQKRPSRIPISRQRSVSKTEQKPEEQIHTSKIPIKSTQPLKLSSAAQKVSEANKQVENVITPEFVNSASIVLKSSAPLKAVFRDVPLANQKSAEIANEMVNSVQIVKDLNRKISLAQGRSLSKKSSIDSTTSSKQLSYTKSLDNDSDSSVSDSNVEELLEPSTDEDSYEEFDEHDEVVESNTEDYNNFDREQTHSATELNINMSEISAKVTELTSNLHKKNDMISNCKRSNSYIEETCESSEDYLSDEDLEEDGELEEVSEIDDILPEKQNTEFIFETKQPTELELMQVRISLLNI